MENYSKIIQGSFPGGKPRSNILIQKKSTVIFQRKSNSPRPVILTGENNAFKIDSSFLNKGEKGIPLTGEILQKMESMFKTNFSSVRIHPDNKQAESIGALAFTTGNDIYFAQGQYNPKTSYGKRLLAHELTHVVQQKKGLIKNPFSSGIAVINDPGMEAEAERMGMRVMSDNNIVQAKLSHLKGNSSNQLVIQCQWRYKSQVAKKDYIITPSEVSKSKKSLSMASFDAPSVELANMQYRFWPQTKTVTMEHVEAYGMPDGTRAGYLLFYRMALHALESGMENIEIGLGVDEYSSTRNLKEAEELGNKEKIKEAKKNLAAVHIYKQLGFDASTAVKLSHSNRPLSEVRDLSLQKASPYWLKWNPPKESNCFLTTACVTSYGLPDDCMELTVLRQFRDEYMMSNEVLKDLVVLYYEIAPLIVEAILKDKYCYRELNNIFSIIKNCVLLIENNKYEETLILYKNMVEKLSLKYLNYSINQKT